AAAARNVGFSGHSLAVFVQSHMDAARKRMSAYQETRSAVLDRLLEVEKRLSGGRQPASRIAELRTTVERFDSLLKHPRRLRHDPEYRGVVRYVISRYAAFRRSMRRQLEQACGMGGRIPKEAAIGSIRTLRLDAATAANDALALLRAEIQRRWEFAHAELH